MFKSEHLILALAVLAYASIIIIHGQTCEDDFKSSNSLEFERYKKVEINDEKNLSLIREFKANKIVCVTMCQLDCSCCILKSINNEICLLYTKNAMNYLFEINEKENEFIYLKSNVKGLTGVSGFTKDLVHFWPLGDSLTDLVGGRNIISRINEVVTTDRHGNKNGAIQFNLGYAQFPIGLYFYQEFTFMIWIKTLSYNHWQRVFDFGEAILLNNLFIGQKLTSGVAEFNVNGLRQQTTNVVFPLNEWVHVAVTSKAKTTLYINANKVIENQPMNPSETIFNYIGKSLYPTDSNAHAVYDDFKIFNRALTKEEISKEKMKVYF